MYPLNDKDLDRLSRDAAEHYDVESSASGWERLEARLDKELPVKEKDRKRFLFWLFFIALLSGGGLVYLLGSAPGKNKLQASHKPEVGNAGKVPANTVPVTALPASESASTNSSQKKATNSATDNKQAVEPATPSATPDQSKHDVSTDNKVAVNNKAATDNKVAIDNKQSGANKTVTGNNSPDLKNKPAGQQPSAIANNNRRQQNRKPLAGNIASGTNNKLSDNKTAKKPENTDNKSGKDLANAENTPDKKIADNDVAVTETNKKTTEPVTTPKPDAVADKDAATDKVADKKDDTPATDSATVEPVTAKKTAVKKSSTPSSKWEFGITAGPDFSNVGFKHGYTTGLNIGVLVGFRISERWLVNTGLIYTKKFYKVDGEDFTPPKHSWLSYQDVTMVKGYCSMFEIPLNIRYDISYNKKGRFFAGTGVSAYLMDKQYYDCDYKNNMGQPYSYDWAIDSNYNQLLSNVNLSIGYERSLGNNFSIQAEPYFKVPLRGLGYGDIKMNSYGLFVTVKFKPGIKSKK